MKDMLKRWLLPFLCLLLAGCSAAVPSVTKETVALDTVISISVYGTDDATVVDGCFEQIRLWEERLSRTVEGSDVWRLNHAAGEPIAVSAETAALIKTALRYSQLSNGAFDITVAPIVDCWDFKNETAIPPSSSVISAKLPLVDYRGVTVSGTQVQLASADAAVDLGGIAKGYIADQVAAYLREQEVESALINLGGNVYAVGDRNGQSWRVGIRDPKNKDGLAAVVQVKNRSVVTSGTYERGFTHEGRWYHHLLDPATGFPAQTGLASVTVVSENSAEGDALATACFVLGKEKGLELIESLPGVEALFIEEDGTLTATEGLSYETAK